ncbi:MAG: IS1634 family transposase, partial [Bacilli bacterium]
MRLKKSVSKNHTNLYIIKDVTINNKRTTKIVEALGNIETIKVRENTDDPMGWAMKRLKQIDDEAKSDSKVIITRLSPVKQIEPGITKLFNGGHLFLQDIYYELGLNKICDKISSKYNFEYDLNSILSNLIYSRIIFPSSKYKTYRLSQDFIEQPNYDLHHIYRALQIICKETTFIQAQLYKNSTKAFARNSKVLYYDCTNFFFTVTEEDELRKYGASKENKPKPIVQMGLFMDGDGIPLAMSINKGNTNEQETLIPLESTIIKDFELANVVVCTDAGLSSITNRKFNNTKNRSFITTQSIKKFKKHLKEWALDPNGWKLNNSNTLFNINDIDESVYYDKIFYKERWINENNLEQRIVVSYSIKYRNYSQNVRNNQVNRTIKLINSSPKRIGKVRSNDFKRFINKIDNTSVGEVATRSEYTLSEDKIIKEAVYDGF